MSARDINCEDVLKSLVRHYLKGSLAFSLQPETAKEMTWDKQKVFLDETIHSKLLKKFPVKNEYAKLFFKKLISCIEPYQEVHDDFYNFLCLVMKNSTDNYCFRHYIIDDDTQNIITIKETNNMVVNGTTGMRTWEAALMLADWALCNKDIFCNKKVLELGSGVGFTGITIAKHCKPDSIVLSDCHEDVLKTINDNIVINFPKANLNEVTQQINAELNIDVMMLDWSNVDQISNELSPDIVIGADIVYDPTILQSLCNVLQFFFNKNVKLQVFIASMIRNIETFNEFVKILEFNDFEFVELSQENSRIVEWDSNNKQRCLLKISKNK